MRRRTRLIGLLGALLCLAPAHLCAHYLFFNEPDPFCPEIEGTAVTYQLDWATQVRLEIWDVFDQSVRVLVDGMQEAGMHMVVWDGRDEEGELLRTGEFRFVLMADNETYSEDATAYCGNDLHGPYRAAGPGGDAAMAFAVGLEVPQSFELLILDEDMLLRALPAELEAPGVVTVFWDLLDENGDPIPGGWLTCALIVPGYYEEILFLHMPPIPLEPVVRFIDRYGVSRAGSPDPDQPTDLDTPLREAWFEFGRPLSSDEFEHMLNTLTVLGALEHTDPVEPWEVSEDSSWIHFPGLTADRKWPDIYGPAEVSFDPAWADPARHYFQVRHLFGGITATNESCDPIGPVDEDDWVCYEEGSPDDPPSIPFSFGPACPNPVESLGVTEMRFYLPQVTQVHLDIIARDGHVIRTILDDNWLPTGTHSILWDLHDDEGMPVDEGLYRAVITFDTNDLVHVGGGDIYVGDPTAAPDLPVIERYLTCFPNPLKMRHEASIVFELERPSRTALSIHDVQGRCVRRLIEGEALSAGRQSRIWDGFGDDRQPLAAGVYFLRLEAGGESTSERIVLLH